MQYQSISLTDCCPAYRHQPIELSLSAAAVSSDSDDVVLLCGFRLLTLMWVRQRTL